VIKHKKETTLINPNKTNSHHGRNPANPRTGSKPNYKKRLRESVNRIKEGF